MGVIAIALKHMFAAGMEHAAIISAIEEMEASSVTSVQVRTVRQERNARYYAKKASEKRLNASYSDVSDATVSLPLEEMSPTPPKTQTPSLFQKDIPPKGGISKKVSLPPENPLVLESQPVAESQKKSRVDKRGTRIPENWRVGPEQRSAAIEAGLPAGSIALEGEKFRDYWLAKTGRDAAKADWMATWRNWCRRAAENAKRFPPRPPDKPKDRGGFAAILQENLDELFGAGNHELSRGQSGYDWPAEPEIISPNRPITRSFDAGGPGLFRDGYRADGLSNIVDLEPCRAYA